MAIRLQVYQNTLEIACGEPVIEGGIRANEVVFTFSPGDETWNGMARVAVFETRVDKRAVLLEDGRSCTIPWEVLAAGSAGSYLRIGLYGTEEDPGGVIVRSTIWADNPYRILPGPDADPGKDPTPDQYQQMLGLTSKVASRLDELGSVETEVKASEQRIAASETAAAASASAARNSAAAAQTSAAAATGANTGAEKARGEAEKAKAAAAISAHNAQVWTEGGTLQDADGGSDPSGARDGARQFAEKAEDAKELAVQAAASAAGAQANAAQAAQEAAARANQAQQSASAADSSRAAAEAAAGNAGGSETNARGSETAARASQTAAEESAAAAKASESASAGNASAADKSREAAEKAAESAQASEMSAGQSAEKAQNALGKGPYIDGSTKTWFVWDSVAEQFVDTGITAEAVGASVAASGLWGIHVDENGDLILSYVGDEAPPLSIDENGNLIYTLSGNEIVIGNVGTGGGSSGQTPNITIGQVETLPAGSDVTATITGQTPNLVLNLGIPQGKQGDTGAGVPPADDVPTDYLLSVGGWVPPPESGGSAPTCRAWDVTVEEDVISYTIPVDDPTAYDYYIYQVSRPSGWSGNLTVMFVRDSDKGRTNGVQIAKHTADSGIIIVRPIDKIPYALSMNYANTGAVIASSPNGTWYGTDGIPASIIIKNSGGNVEAGTRIVLRGYQFESI